MSYFDTHCHIHSADYPNDAEIVLSDALASGVESLICVGTSFADSCLAIDFADSHKGVAFASVGLHPHDAKRTNELVLISKLLYERRPVAIGEFGLDYHYNLSSRDEQIHAFKMQLEMAKTHELPAIFHVREAWDDFFSVIAHFPEVKGVVHSFTGGILEFRKIVKLGLYVGLNGIMTFTKDPRHSELLSGIDLDWVVLETDSPLLTPVPLRGTINTPANVSLVGEFLARELGLSAELVAQKTTVNAKRLFDVNL